MKKVIKWTLRILGILILLVIIAAIVIPIFFKDEIIQTVKNETNKQLNAKVDFGDVGLSIFSTFPDFGLSLENVSVAGINEFEGDTLAKIKQLYVKLDLMSVLFGDKYEIKTIELENPDILLKVLPGGKANWDIAKESTDTVPSTEPADTSASNFAMELQKLSIINGNIVYDDMDGGIYAEVKQMNHTLKGDFTASTTDISTKTIIDSLTLRMDGITYLKKSKLDITADLEADLDNSKYTFRENQIAVNELGFSIDGFIQLLDDGYDMDLKYAAAKNEFRSFLSLVPAIWTQDFASIQTEGSLEFSGSMKGKYTDNALPAFDFNLGITNAMFKYPDLPKSVSGINLKMKASNPGGDADNTVIDIPAFSMVLGADPVNITAHVTHPVSDPNIASVIKAKLDLAGVSDFYPLSAGEQLSGKLASDISFKGKLSSIENEKYEEFEAKGSFILTGMKYTSADLPDPLLIEEMNLQFSPQSVALENFAMKTGKSDIQAKGKIDNLLSYVFRGDLLKGAFVLNSTFLDVNPFLVSEETPATPAAEGAEEVPLTVFEVPANIDFTIGASIGKLIYDNMEMTDMKGIIVVKDKRIGMNGLNMNMLGGKLAMNGSYETTNPLKPLVEMKLDIVGFDFRKSWETFGTIKKFAPIMEKCVGTYSTTVNFNSILDNEMMPVYSSMNGGGTMKTSNVAIRGLNTLDKIGDALKMEEMKRMVVQNVNVMFEFKDGKIFVKPFDITYSKIKGKVEGWNSFDETMSYVVNLEIPTSMMGAQAKAAMNGLAGEAGKLLGKPVTVGETANVDVLVTGTVSDPKVKVGMKGAMDNAMNDLKDQAKEEFDKKKEELEAKAKEEADRLKKEAEDKLNQETDKAKAEAEKAKQEAEAKAKAEADRLKKEAEEKAKKEAEDAKKKLEGLFKK
ncbi:MAG: AsmA family protein [Bacteroidetes bacterium]|nr:AsmA family protein [Bacteroidota bacterium]MBU1718460.1 AsmA family protein [Bacteroidota bacterium]